MVFRSLYESVIYSEIINCLEDLKKYDNSNNVLIDGLALSYLSKNKNIIINTWKELNG